MKKKYTGSAAQFLTVNRRSEQTPWLNWPTRQSASKHEIDQRTTLLVVRARRDLDGSVALSKEVFAEVIVPKGAEARRYKTQKGSDSYLVGDVILHSERGIAGACLGELAVYFVEGVPQVALTQYRGGKFKIADTAYGLDVVRK